jgi:hypothetical protein
VVALNTNTGQIVAVGVEAKRMIGRTPGNIVAVRPLNFDHVGAHIGEHHRAVGPGDVLREVDDADTCEG